MWLPFMIWFFLDPYWKHASSWHWVWNTAAGLFFIFLYLQAFSRPRIRNICIVLIVLMVVIFIALNLGGVGLLIYAAAAGGFNTKFRWVAALLAFELGILLFYSLRLHLEIGYWVSMLLLIVLVGLGNHHWAVSHCAEEKLRLAHDEVEHLAKVAERERIARDLHDVLGHTLSLITLKSELARKLVDRDPERAKQEMQDVENTSRAALADVREAIRGYRTEGIFAELARARAALEPGGVTVECATDRVVLSPEQESVVSPRRKHQRCASPTPADATLPSGAARLSVRSRSLTMDAAPPARKATACAECGNAWKLSADRCACLPPTEPA